MPKTMVYVARRKCGCVVAAVVDDTDELIEGVEERRKAISDCLRIWIRAGWRVDSVAAEEVPVQWFTACPHDIRQAKLVHMAEQLTQLEQAGAVTITNTATGERVTLP